MSGMSNRHMCLLSINLRNLTIQGIAKSMFHHVRWPLPQADDESMRPIGLWQHVAANCARPLDKLHTWNEAYWFRIGTLGLNRDIVSTHICMCAGVCARPHCETVREEKGWQHWQLSGLRKKRNCLWLAFRNLLWFDISAWQLITALQLTCCCCCCCCRFRNGRNQVLVPIANCKIQRKLHNFHSTTRWGRTPATRTSMNECETGPHSGWLGASCELSSMNAWRPGQVA